MLYLSVDEYVCGAQKVRQRALIISRVDDEIEISKFESINCVGGFWFITQLVRSRNKVRGVVKSSLRIIAMQSTLHGWSFASESERRIWVSCCMCVLLYVCT